MRDWLAKQTPEQKAAAYARRDRDRMRESDRRRASSPERKEAARLRAARRQQRPEQARAHTAVHRAVERGELTRGECVHADDTCSERIVAHHPDYAKPLEVVWMCQSHHLRMHKAEVHDA